MKKADDTVRLILRAYRTVTMRQHDVIRLHYGFADGYDYTFEEIAQQLNLTPQQVQRAENTAITTLRKSLQKDSDDEDQSKSP
ncbi:hypothetical protein LCGC14_1098250 [marine sediment metagenome]|uniref:RNA polymerase sigma-70 domain-containing protein n=1 Tax=marine sediment metagenome TaxID=412755 RepID=A0A0F9PTE2_9ZZZZ